MGIDLQPEHVVFVPHAFRIDNHAAGSDFRSEVAAQGFDVFRRGLNSHHEFRAAIERLARIDADICAAIEDDVAVADAAFAGAVDLPVLLGKIVEYGVGTAIGDPIRTHRGLPPLHALFPRQQFAVDRKSARGFQLLAQEPVGGNGLRKAASLGATEQEIAGQPGMCVPETASSGSGDGQDDEKDKREAAGSRHRGRIITRSVLILVVK